VELLRAIARGKRTIDLGFIDQGRMSAKRAEGTWLHNELGYEALCADCQDRETLLRLDLEPADVVVAGELIEHLDCPAPFSMRSSLLSLPVAFSSSRRRTASR
jgi:hypothetical protein